jgi:hypothetical protein
MMIIDQLGQIPDLFVTAPVLPRRQPATSIDNRQFDYIGIDPPLESRFHCRLPLA